MKLIRTWGSRIARVFQEAGSLRQASQTLLARGRFLQERAGSMRSRGSSAGLRQEWKVWAQGLEEQKKSFHSLLGVMEVEFVAISKGLMRLNEQLNQIQQQCQSLADLTGGRTEDAAVQFAFQLLKKVEDLLLASYDQYDHVFAAFHELQRWLSQLPKQHDELVRALLPLAVLTTSFRIEASRHPAEIQEVFSGLATKVNRMVKEVRGTLERQFDELAASEQIVRSLMEQVAASIQLQRKEAASALESGRSHLRMLSEALFSSGNGAADLTRQNQAVTRHIGSIVMALQCQDIASQKIVHIGEAMDEMRTHLEEASLADSASDSDPRQFVSRAARIQSHQIQDVFDQLNGAAESLETGMQSLRTETGAAAAVAVKVGGTTLNANVASQSQARIGAMLHIVKQAVEKIGEILAAFESLQARFVNCSKEATELAIDVRYASLNAQVFAVHVRDGATLEVLATRMRIVSDETLLQVGQMGAALRRTDEMISNLRQRLADFQSLGQAEQQLLADEAILSRKKLSELETAIPALIGGITGQQETFAHSVDAVLAKVQFPVAVAEAHSRSIDFFQGLMAWSGEGCSEAAADSASEKIDSLKSNYTMESERKAHAAALRAEPPMPGANVSPPAVEMFDQFESEPAPASAAREDLPLPKEDSKHQPSPVDLAAGTLAPPKQGSPLAPEKPMSSEGLGDNVELF